MKKFRLSDHLHESFRNLGKRPVTDWRLALATFAVLLVLGILLNASIYASLAQRDGTSSAIETKEIFDREKLEATAQSQRNRKSAADSASSSVFSDPSL